MNVQAITAPPVTGGFNEASFEAFLKGRDEPDWLRRRRREAFATFMAAPWPSSRDEEWRRTDIRALKLDAISPPGNHEPAAEDFTAIESVWNTLGANYGAGVAQVNGAAV